MKILLVEDDLHLGKALCRALELAGFTLCWVRLVNDAQQRLGSESFDLMLLDLTLPDGDGLTKLVEWRKAGEKIPIIILTARDQVQDLVEGLDSGADDFLAKPFVVPELISRVNAISRRIAGYASQVWTLDNLTLNPDNHQVMLNDTLLLLSKKEYRLLHELMRSPGQVVRKMVLEQRLFDDGEVIESNSLEVHIHNLRRKMGSERIVTIRGVGYLLNKEGP
ncbi:DNA-binding response OmpR family regulator [Buttiauxella sp. BIGb0552]|uniref:response regulator n=1 Tax=Buttiauxella sp. BIGb0552 TaxID=2485120 RepID=UPI0010661999|nr:response regulator [Buttiauxella sp. BIGb0552]TDX17041.1 DNA-binding response OmpR family regulator [Buttiauxella sp. BIGb0552]